MMMKKEKYIKPETKIIQLEEPYGLLASTSGSEHPGIKIGVDDWNEEEIGTNAFFDNNNRDEDS